jgi:hypothetical protein
LGQRRHPAERGAPAAAGCREASSSLSGEFRDKLPEIPWQHIRGFRNHAVHAYFSIDWEIVREVADVNVRELDAAVMTVLLAEFPDVAARLTESDDPSEE